MEGIISVVGNRDHDSSHGVIVNEPWHQSSYRHYAEDRVQRHDTPPPGIQGRELARCTVSVSFIHKHVTCSARKLGQHNANFGYQVHGVQRVHGPGQGRRRPRARHFFAKLWRKWKQVSPHDHLFQRCPAIREFEFNLEPKFNYFHNKPFFIILLTLI